MNVIAVDDEQLALSHMEKIFAEVSEITKAKTFLSPSEAMEWLGENLVDVAFLDIKMRGIDGLTLAKQIKELQPRCAIVFATGYADYAMPAYKIHASGYLLKPITPQAVKMELLGIINPPYYSSLPKNNVTAQCFGNFEVFLGGKLGKFKYSKSKELFAYLIDRRGAYCPLSQVCSVLWEDRVENKALRSQLRHLIADLKRALKEVGAENTLVRVRGMVAVVTENIECDYYHWLSGDPRAVNKYTGEYMSQYAWAKMTTERLGTKI